MYNKEIMDRFLAPKFVGAVKGASAVGQAQDPNTNEMIKFSFAIDEDSVISDCKFKAFGSPVVIALSDATCENIIGMSIEDLEEISESQVLNYLKDIPEERIYVVFLIIDALNDAIDDYYKKLRRLEKKMQKENKENNIVAVQNDEIQENKKVVEDDEDEISVFDEYYD